MTANPILVEVVRGGTVESVHRGAACVVDRHGTVLRAWGDAAAAICPRSAIKPIQALPLLDSGAAAAFGVSEEELALACASHSGEPMHVDRVAAWLKRMGLSADDLACGAHAPTNEVAAQALVRAGAMPCPLHNNCSGKHTGFLCCALHLGVPTKGYERADHPVQRAVLAALSAMSDVDVSSGPLVIDGCSAPNVFLPLQRLALAWARLSDRTPIVAAMTRHPLLMSGTGRPCAQIIPALADRGFVKVGAEGVFAACLPAQGLGVAVKIDDGAGRAATIAMVAILEGLGAFRRDADLSSLRENRMINWRGLDTGVIRPAAAPGVI